MTAQRMTLTFSADVLGSLPEAEPVTITGGGAAKVKKSFDEFRRQLQAALNTEPPAQTDPTDLVIRQLNSNAVPVVIAYVTTI